ncbi:hypothetical protein [Phytomonospora endophytica]|uniref:Uncharacterized protein n=1 Tax=Phytomonospora endophytica TaxID=714109 RepID=A0A841FPR3_9ACTN|nr:hypothetical protein [Phytomonospora endophytica]MBB6035542.1 hypothetical protein [Phytomonospora endophytica]GIG70095.1 hypothetical protein Pen01_63900 [Phytomonospora endophytica]
MDERELNDFETEVLRDLRQRLQNADDVPALDLAEVDSPRRPDVEAALRRLYEGDYIDGFVPDDRDYPVMIESLTSKGEGALRG